jgi:hypothetical protein
VKSSTDLYKSTALEKKGSRYNPQLDDCLIRGFVHNFSLTTVNEAVGKRKIYVDNQLLDLPGPYHRYVIGTFNTCPRGPTHRSLTDTGGGYNLEGVGFSYTTHRHFVPTVSPFHLRARSVSNLTKNLTQDPRFKFKKTYGCHMVFRPLGHLL